MAMLILSVTIINVNAWERNLIIENNQLANSGNDADAPLKKDYFFTSFDALFVSVGLNNLPSIPRVPINTTKTGDNLHQLLNHCFSQLAFLQLFTTKTTYVSLCSQKGDEGYYIYALRKLLI